MSHITIIIIPTIMPKITVERLAIAKASGISSKHIIAVISPDANESTKLKNLFELLFSFTPISPPSVVPNVPKNKPIRVVCKISLISITPFSLKLTITKFIWYLPY